MKILHVTRDFPPRNNGGISTAVAGLVDALAAEGVASVVVSFDGYRPRTKTPSPGPARLETAATAEVLRIEHPSQLDQAVRFVESRDVDIHHAHHSLLWPFIESLPKRPCVLTPHVLQHEQNRLRGVSETASSRAQTIAVLAADAVFAPSQFAADRIRELCPDARVRAAPLGVVDRPGADGRRSAIAYIGRYSDVRGLADWLEALGDVELADLEPVIIGGLPDNPRAEKRWREQVAQIQSRTPIALTGWLSPEEVWAWLGRSQIVVVPSWIETFGMVCAEAMLSACAVVAANAGALPELITDGRTGQLVPPRSPERLASAVSALADDRRRCRELGSAARAHVRHNKLWGTAIKAHLDSYDALMR